MALESIASVLGSASTQQPPEPNPPSELPEVPGGLLCQMAYEGQQPRFAGGEPATDEEVVQNVGRSLIQGGYAPVSAEKIIKALRYAESVVKKRRIEGRIKSFQSAVGPRYADCTLDNYRVDSPPQRKALDAVKEYAANIAKQVESGSNVVLFGPSGSGKDHLACGLARKGIEADVDIVWRNGRDLFGKFRDAMDADNESESKLVSSFMDPAVLLISDPLPPHGPLSAYQADTLYRIVDARYRARRSVWVTLNVKDGQEADERLGVAIVDRLRHGAMAVACNWPSFRKPLGQE